jgi:hypothetical protein
MWWEENSRRAPLVLLGRSGHLPLFSCRETLSNLNDLTRYGMTMLELHYFQSEGCINYLHCLAHMTSNNGYF